MGETKFSKGPWSVDPDAKHPWIVQCPHVGFEDVPEFKGNVCSVGFLPNAHLIAAAPKLYAVLAKALADSGCDGDLCFHQWHEDARAALYQALGEPTQPSSNRSED